jgi:murein DD-endopeptidase MepM/ murein hydrolase activator NlpD
MKSTFAVMLAVTLAGGAASADPKVRVEPKSARPGDAVLVTVTGTAGVPKGSHDGTPLEFFRAKQGYQALFAVPLDAEADSIAIDIHGLKKHAVLAVKSIEFPETDLVVEEELANPDGADGKIIDADNGAIVAATKKLSDTPQFTRAFVRPRGTVSSRFGEWRTFNDGHRSQHLGFDIPAKEGAPVKAVNAGTVTLVRETLLAGNVVVVAHGGGISSAYFHLSASSVAEGDVIERGAEVGHAGHTGRTTGPHLHLSIHVPGGFVDPARFFTLGIAPAPAQEPTRAARRVLWPHFGR